MWTSALAVAVLAEVVAVATVGVDGRVVGAVVHAEQGVVALALLGVGVGARSRTAVAVGGDVGLRGRRAERAPELTHADRANDVAGQAGEDAVLAEGVRAQDDAGPLHGAEEAGHGRGARGGEAALLRRDDDQRGAVGEPGALPIQIAGEGDCRNSGGKDTGRNGGEQNLLHGLSPLELLNPSGSNRI